MASFRDKQPKAIAVPRRKTTTLEDDARARAWDGVSEAASRHEMFVPVAYTVHEPVQTQPSAPHLEVSTSSQGGDHFYAEGEDSSPTGTYSLYSRGNTESDWMARDYEGDTGQDHGRCVGTREWAKQQESSGKLTVSSESPWEGPGRPTAHAHRQGTRIYRESAGADPSADGGPSGDGYYPPYPYTQQLSANSGMSHDLSGFSAFGGHERDLSRESLPASCFDHVTDAAAAARAADETNAQAAAYANVRDTAGKQPSRTTGRSRQSSREGELSSSRKSRGSKIGDTAEMKEETVIMSDSEQKFEVNRGNLGYHTGHHQPEGATGEFAVMRPRKVFFTPLMFLICGIMLIIEFSENKWKAEPIAENPSYGPSVATLEKLGAKRTDLIVDDGDWWRLWTPMFLHAGVIHFLFNMIGFLQVGAMVENVFGWWRVAVIYLVSGVFGTIASAIFVPTQVMTGASGAIFGVFGALWADLWQNWSVYSDKCWALTVLAVLTVVNVFLGLLPYLDNFAHIGGILMGFFLGLGLLVQKREDDYGSRLNKKCYQTTLQLVSAVAVPTLLIVGLALLYGRSDPSEWCGWCENISCVEFPAGDDPWWRCDECSTSGYSADYFSNGTTVFTCPDQTTVSTTSCEGSTESEILDCCIAVCL